MIPTDVYFLSYNIRNPEDDSDVSGYSGYYEYPDREIKVRDYLVNSGADIIGLQEVGTLSVNYYVTYRERANWFDVIGNEDVKTGLTAAGYTCVTGKNIYGGEDYSDGLSKEYEKTMYNPIYFKTEKYTLIAQGTKWLTSTPDTPSTIYGANTTKALNYVVLEDNSTHQRFVYVNLHTIVRNRSEDKPMYLKNSDGDENTEHLVQEAEIVYLRAILQDLQDTYDLPMLIGGDFNNSYNTINKQFKNSVITEDGVVASGDYKGQTYVNAISSEGTPEESVRPSIARDKAIDKVVSSSCKGSGVFDQSYDGTSSPIDLWWTLNFDGVVYLYEVEDNKFAEEGNRYPSDHIPIKLVVTLYGN